MQDANRAALAPECVQTHTFDLAIYARKHRYRVRNIHDGGPAPPARRRKSDTAKLGYVGASDRWDAIVGYNGYIADEGEPGQLGIYLQYRSARGVKRAHARIQGIGGTVKQVGDTEIVGSVRANRIEDALKLIRVSKVPMRNPNPTFGTVSGGPTRARIARIERWAHLRR